MIAATAVGFACGLLLDCAIRILERRQHRFISKD
jgi:hypothetical protein